MNNLRHYNQEHEPRRENARKVETKDPKTKKRLDDLEFEREMKRIEDVWRDL